MKCLYFYTISTVEWQDIPCRIGGVVSDLDLNTEFAKGDLREKSRPILLGVAAARRALEHSNYQSAKQVSAQRCGR